MAIGLLLVTMRHICAADRFVRKGLWPELGNYPTLTHKMSGKRLGIVGLGRIGLAVAKRAEAFGCKISYLARAEKSGLPYKFYATVLELAKNSDMLVLTCTLTKETTHLVGREVLDALGPEGFLVNIARGPVVDEQELVKALVEERIAGAGLDVFENEPQVPQELWNMENVVLLPHMACTTHNTAKAILELIIGNLDAHFSGNPLLTPCVDD
jgi:lactate dehydrogenase-like 2-hydroxyacid dehydrogenase